jgi:hypothetical protein
MISFIPIGATPLALATGRNSSAKLSLMKSDADIAMEAAP